MPVKLFAIYVFKVIKLLVLLIMIPFPLFLSLHLKKNYAFHIIYIPFDIS